MIEPDESNSRRNCTDTDKVRMWVRIPLLLQCLTIKSINMSRARAKELLKSIILNDSMSDQSYYDNIIKTLNKHLDVQNKPMSGLTEHPIFQPGDVVKCLNHACIISHYGILIDLMVAKNMAVIRFVTHNNDLHPGIMIPVESRFLEGYFLPYNVIIPLTAIERCCFPYDNVKQFKQLKK